MTNKIFIPELHDIGKLLDKENEKDKAMTLLGLKLKGHCVIPETIKISSLSWWTQYHHSVTNEKDFNDWKDINESPIPNEGKYCLFLLILADHLASSVSRAIAEIAKTNKETEGIHKLWNYKYYENAKQNGNNWAAYKTKSDIDKIINEIENCKSGQDFLDKYEQYLLLTPEDKYIPRNVTSLYTHIELVGKIYRVLAEHTELIKNPDGTIAIKYNRETVKTIKEAEGGKRTDDDKKPQDIEKGKWQARIAKCYIKFPHSFVRLQDINLLKKRFELIQALANSQEYRDNVMLATQDFLMLFLAANQNIDEMFRPFLEAGFYVEIQEIKADLGILSSILDDKFIKAKSAEISLSEDEKKRKRYKILTKRDTKIYKKILMRKLPEEIKPPICDICQQREGIERPKENIREWVCNDCQKIRCLGKPFKIYSKWEEENIKVCWFKVELNQTVLEEWLRNEFIKYVAEHNLAKADKLKEEFRPLALQTDFSNDYMNFLRNFWDRLNEIGSDEIEMPLKENYELGVFKYSPELTQKVMDIFFETFDTHFPDCVSDCHSPIRFSLSISNIKYPIREHWRFFERTDKNFINIRYSDVFDEQYNKDELQSIINAINSETASSFLHNLVQLENKVSSEIYLAVRILESKEEYPEVYELFKSDIMPSKLLNIYKLLKGVEDNV